MRKAASLFPERQLIVRTQHGTRFLRLSPAAQQAGLGALFVGLAVVTWLVIAQYNASRLANAAMDDLRRLQDAYQQIAQSPVSPMPETSDIAVPVAAQPVEKPVVITPVEVAVAIKSAEPDNLAAERVSELERKLAASEAERRLLADERSLFIEERSRIEAERRRLASATLLDKRPSAAFAAQQEAITQLIARAKVAIERASRHVTQLGINPDKLIASQERGRGGVGGPFIEYAKVARGQPVHASLVTLGDRVGKLTELRRAMASVPAGAPLDKYQISSPFGVRRDPFHGRLALHAGIDLTVVSGGEVKARAPGKVVTAGWGGVYGNMVEIDHGFGLRTRYGHLSRVTVRPGDVIKTNTTVGHVGSSGRSTAPHLHYEVTFNGKHLDPKTFLEAKQHVFQD